MVLDQILEHVSNQKTVLSEAFRVLKPGGAIYVACPNYLRFYESHYKLWFWPLMPKFLGSWYLRLRGRDPVLLDQLTYTTNWRARNLLASLNYRVIDLNSAGMLNRIDTPETSALGKKARIVRQAGQGSPTLKCRAPGSYFLRPPARGRM